MAGALCKGQGNLRKSGVTSEKDEVSYHWLFSPLLSLQLFIKQWLWSRTCWYTSRQYRRASSDLMLVGTSTMWHCHSLSNSCAALIHSREGAQYMPPWEQNNLESTGLSLVKETEIWRKFVHILKKSINLQLEEPASFTLWWHRWWLRAGENQPKAKLSRWFKLM